MGKTITNITSIEAFAEEVSQAIRERVEAEVSIAKVNKNNGLVLTGITVKGNSNMAPTIYLEKFFDQYTDGDMSLSDVVEEIIRTCEEHTPATDFNVEFFTNWNEVSKSIKMKLINLNQNEEMLKDTPHMVFGDLAVIFQVILDSTAEGRASITIKTQHMKSWEKTTEDLYEAAKSNKDDYVVKSMLEVLSEMMGGEVEDMLPPGEEGPKMFVASNESKMNGAVAMIDSEVLENFGKENGSFFVLPSSIHEVLFVVADGEEQENLNMMVSEVNATQVSIEEQLSDHAYYYDAERNVLLESIDSTEAMTLACA